MDAFLSPDPRLVWGLYQRGLALILLISFTSIAFQIVPAVGDRSIVPIRQRFERLRKDFPTWKRFLYFPTLLWLSQRNGFLRSIPIIGILAALAVIYGGPHSIAALAICYVCYLSLDIAMALVLPWDTLLFEATVLSLLLPTTEPLPSLAATEAPAPILTWAFRLLVFRVMFGFGKQKFLGSRKQDLMYLKGFFINQPLLSPGGWYAHKLPDWFLKLAVLYMFFVEIPAPFFAFFPGVLSFVLAASTIFLMAGIQATGNFGYFSVLTMIVAIPLFDNTTPGELDVLHLFAAGQPLFVNAFVLVHTLAATITFPFNSWLAQGWHLWAFWYQLPRAVQPVLGFFRWLHPFRWVHPYGVFPPNNTPGVKITLLLEVTWDGEHWHEASFKYAPSNPNSAPHFVAPHHPRGEQAIIYDTFGMNYTSLMSTMISAWDPSAYCMRSPSPIFAQAVLRMKPSELFPGTELAQRTDPFKAARITTVMLEPLSIAEKRRTGAWWKRTYVGPHVPAQELDTEFNDYVLGAAELWHFDAIFWRRRSYLRPLMDRAAAGDGDPLEVCRLGAEAELSDDDVQRFWVEFVPMLAEVRHDFNTLPATLEAVDARFSRAERRALYRLLGRFALMLVVKLEPHYLHQGLSPEIPVRTYFHLWLLANHVLGGGKEAYLRALAEPLSVIEEVPRLTTETGLYPLAVFRSSELTFDAQKMRLLEQYFYPHDQAEKRRLDEQLKTEEMSGLSPLEHKLVGLMRKVSGMYSLMPFIRASFRGPAFDKGYPELYPRFGEKPSGEVVIEAYAVPDPSLELAPDLKSVPTDPTTGTS